MGVGNFRVRGLGLGLELGLTYSIREKNKLHNKLGFQNRDESNLESTKCSIPN